MISRNSNLLIPLLGVLCIGGAVAVGLTLHAPTELDLDYETTAFDGRIPDAFEPEGTVPTMEAVLEKHLFVKERKATGINSFPDLLVKGVYVGEKQSAVLSLKSRPEISMRIWTDSVEETLGRIIDPRDPRKPIADFLGEWEVRAITFEGLQVEHLITGEVETYKVDYTPAKHAKDSAGTGYGQGMLAEAQSTKVGTKGTNKRNRTAVPGQVSGKGALMGQMRNMLNQMTPEQRTKLMKKLSKAGGDSENGGKKDKSTKKNKSGSSKKNKKNR